MPYSPTVWINNSSPPLSATNLNKLTNELESQALAQGISHTLPTWVNNSPPALTDPVPLDEMERVCAAVATSLGLSYTVTDWGACWSPARNAANLNKLEQAAQANRGVIDAALPLPALISSGGTYTGTRTGTVQVRTTEPVTIVNSTISNSTSAALLDLNHTGARVTVQNTTFNGTPTSGGVHGSLGKAIYGYGLHTLIVDHCTVNYTWGIRVDAVQAGGSFIVRYCKGNNLQGDTSDFSHFSQSANNPNSFTYEMAWNEVTGDPWQTQVEDIISIHSTHNATPKIHDNYLYGAWPWYQGMNPQSSDSGSGIMIENASNCEVYSNIVVATTNVGIGMASGGNNLIHDNRCVSWGKTPEGVELDYANVGIYCYAGTGGNQVYANSVGWMGSPGTNPLMRNDLYLPFDGNVWYAQNTALYPGQTITRAHETAEWDRWVAKKAAAGVTVGAA